MTCQMPPSFSGAKASPYSSGGRVYAEIRQRLQVGPSAAPYMMSAVPTTGEQDRRHAEEADVERADPEVEQVAADQACPRAPGTSSRN
jgi:hypothetical protein